MDFKKFNGTTWETVRHKIYGSGTESLTAFPAQIQASGETLTDYLISGNTVQDGTPTPEAPVDVVGCGDWDETHQSYKLTPTVTGTEYPIYLGQVETTRRIKKLVLTGEEGWVRIPNRKCYYVNASTGCPTDYLKQTITTSICSHYQSQKNTASGSNEVEVGHFCFYTGGGCELYIGETTISSAADFKTYLAAQYAAGTPVTVWYVLARPETAIVNEPLHKIGDYADTITMAQAGVTIPTFDGDNIISFGTAVQPSAMSAAFKGWHPVQGVKQYDGNDWS